MAARSRPRRVADVEVTGGPGFLGNRLRARAGGRGERSGGGGAGTRVGVAAEAGACV